MTVSHHTNAATMMIDAHLSAGRGTKPAYIDPTETLTYAALAERTNRVANLMQTYGIARETRVALLLLDTVDYPPAFWGAIKAGVIPIALNTLLTAEQYAYILDDSRAQAIIVSAPLVDVIKPVLGQLPFLKHMFVAGGEAPAFALNFREELSHQSAEAETAPTHSDETAFWLYSSGSTGMPKGTRHVHTSLMATAKPLWSRRSRHPRNRRRLFRRKDLLRLRPRQRHELPALGRRHHHLAARTPNT